MDLPPQIFDQDLRDLRFSKISERDRANFLHSEAISHVAERLEEINRTFPDRRIITSHPELWANSELANKILPMQDDLGIPDQTLDLIIHGLSLHNSNDPVGQLVQARRALRSDGMFIAVLFGGQTLHELRRSIVSAETEIRGGISPRIHPMGEIRDLGALLQRAGFALPVADSFAYRVQYKTVIDLMHDLRRMNETNILTSQSRTFLRRDVLRKTCEIYADNFTDRGGKIVATFELVFLTGWAPSLDQPKPLQPGSAKARLADALGSVETPAGEKTPR